MTILHANGKMYEMDDQNLRAHVRDLLNWRDFWQGRLALAQQRDFGPGIRIDGDNVAHYQAELHHYIAEAAERGLTLELDQHGWLRYPTLPGYYWYYSMNMQMPPTPCLLDLDEWGQLCHVVPPLWTPITCEGSWKAFDPRWFGPWPTPAAPAPAPKSPTGQEATT